MLPSIPSMFGAIKKIFSRKEETSSSSANAARPVTPKPVSSLPQPNQPRKAVKASPSTADESFIHISFAAIQPHIPQELFRKEDPSGLDNHKFALPKSVATEQIGAGSVKVSLQQLRAGAPPGLFIDPGENDTDLITLPLKEIIGHLPPGAFTKREDQTVVEVPDNIADLFGENAQNVRISNKEAAAKGSDGASSAGGTSPAAKPATSPATEASPLTSTPPIAAPANLAPSTNFPSSGELVPAAVAKPTETIQSTLIPAPNLPTPDLGPTAVATAPVPKATPQAKEETKTLETSPLPTDANVEKLEVPISELMADWPESIRLEIGYLRLNDSICGLPLPQIKEGLRSGAVRYHWKDLRSWIQPTPPAEPTTHGELVLELSIKSLSNRIISALSGNLASNPAPPPTAFPAPATPKPTVKPESTTPKENKIAPSPALADLLASTGATTPTATLEPKATLPPSPAAKETPEPSPTPDVPEAAATKPPPPTESTSNDEIISLVLASFISSWPEEIQEELSDLDLEEAKLDLPVGTIEPAMKLGKIAFPWNEVSGWLNPPSENAANTENGETIIDLPLSIIAPLFMQLRPNQEPRKKVEANLDIPDVFDHEAEEETEEEEYEEIEEVESTGETELLPAPGKRKPAESLPELFGQPDKKNWTPNEIVQHTTKLEEVTGSLIALQDGLLVASSMPSEWKTETIAAFIPQIFGRMRQYSGELSMGDLTSIRFTVEQGTFQVFNAGIIYFAVLGDKNACLPIPDLNLIALELSRHTK